ncbi:hypothetical protein KKF60_00960 [Patescibacteria group bacterium]|nr:hypothetical protein [Patescibacteria group bacterium]MBU4458463.1 hypothetical protein [Patescibacteria group bacterium]
MENDNQENLLKEFEWRTLEFEKTEKNKSWFIFPAIIVIILGIIALITDNLLFLVLILLGFFTFYVYAKKEPRTIKFKIDERGIEVDDRLHTFDSIRSFWIFYNPASPAGGPPMEKEISFRSRKTFFPYIKIPLADQNPSEIRKYLLRFLPEKRHKESLIDIWMKRIGF